eukprot:120465-Chlamydomonas_euryale.AAC.1
MHTCAERGYLHGAAYAHQRHHDVAKGHPQGRLAARTAVAAVPPQRADPPPVPCSLPPKSLPPPSPPMRRKRYSKAKAMGASGGSDGGDAAAQPSAHADPLGLQQANYGAKYEEHMTQLQAQLEEVSARIAAAQKQADALAYEKEQCVGEAGVLRAVLLMSFSPAAAQGGPSLR